MCSLMCRTLSKDPSSFITKLRKMVKRAGDKIYPWKTPSLTWNQFVKLSPIVTVHPILSYKFSIITAMFGLIHSTYNVFYSTFLHIISTGGLKSLQSACAFWHCAYWLFAGFGWNTNIASLVPFPGQNPNWCSLSFESIFPIIMMRITVVNTLPGIDSSDMVQ